MRRFVGLVDDIQDRIVPFKRSNNDDHASDGDDDDDDDDDGDGDGDGDGEDDEDEGSRP